MKTNLMFFFIAFLTNFTCSAQNILTLEDLLNKIIYDTDEYRSLKKKYNIGSLEYEISKNSLLPRVNLDINAPTYDHSITVVTQPNGDDLFIDRQQANSSFVFDILQPISLTGGYLNIKSSFNRIDLISTKRVNYSSNWFNAALVQPLNGYNEYKWIRKINESKLKSNTLDFCRETEQLKVQLLEMFFDIMILEYKVNLTNHNLTLRTKKIEKTRQLFEAGRILETDLLQEKIAINELKMSNESQAFQLESLLRDFRNITGVPDAKISSDSIASIDNLELNAQLVKEKFIEFGINQVFETRQIEADRDYTKALRERGIQASLQLAYGLNSNSTDITSLYDTPSKREYVNFKISLPIINWNEKRRLLSIAKEKKEIIENDYKIALENVDTKVAEILNYTKALRNQKELSRQNLELLKRHLQQISYQFEYGRITSNDLEYEMFKQETSHVDHLNNLKMTWKNRYDLRRITLFDFYTMEDIKKI